MESFAARLLFCLSFLGSASWAQAPFAVVSDFDDTIKITNVRSSFQSVCNTLLSRASFHGMGDLFRGFKANDAKIAIVSGGVIHLQVLMYDDLRAAGIPYDYISMRKFLAAGTLEFKYRNLVKLMDQWRAPMVLIGDDTQVDPDAYAQFQERYPSHVLSVYVHRVSGRPIPHGQTAYFHPFEIAVREHIHQRIGLSQVEKLANEVLRAQSRSELFPDYAPCPQSLRDFGDLPWIGMTSSDLSRFVDPVLRHMLDLCQPSHP